MNATTHTSSHMGGPRFVAAALAALCVATAPTPSFAEAKEARLVCSGYTGSTALENFQALIKLPDGVTGFAYTDLADSTAGSDIWFTDADDNVIPHEIDTWNASGTSYLWVKIPSLADATTSIVMHWGDSSAKQTTTDSVWDGFVGVWHMNGTGTASEPDSTGNGLSATPLNSSNASVALDTTTGCVGAGRAISVDHTYFSVGSSSSPYYNYITTKKQFSMSGWCNLSSTPSNNGYQRIFCGMSSGSLHSWDVWRENDSKLGIRSGNGSANSSSTGYGVSLATGGNDWHYLTVVWDGSSATVYNNGGRVGAPQTLRENTHPNSVFTIGGRVGTQKRSFVGSFDEVRMYNGVLTADRVEADYKTMNEPTKFLVAVADGAHTATWTGAVDGDVSKPGNWSLTIDGEAASDTLPTTDYSVVISGNNVNMQVPSGTTLNCAAVRIQNCTFTADCDWRGLSVTPSIVGEADLNGKNLYLNDLSAEADSSFTNKVAGTVSEVRFTATASKTSETDFIDSIDNLATYSNARIAIVNAANLSPSGIAMGNSGSNYPVFVHSNGTLGVSGTINLGVSAYGAYEQHGGDVTANKLAVGTTSGGTGEYTITNGTLTATSTTTQIGSNSGKGIFSASGNADVTFGNTDLTISNGETTFNVGDDASVKVHGYLMLARGNGPTRAKATINQTGGTVETTGEVQLGYTGTGTYNISGGSLVAGNNLQVGRGYGSGSSSNQGVGLLNQSGGSVVCNSYLSIGRWASGNAYGIYTMTGGTYISPNSVGIVGEAGTGTLDVSGTGVMFFPKGLSVGHNNASTSKGTVYVHDGGRIVASTIYHNTANTAASAVLTVDGGTIVATNVTDGANFISGLNTFKLGTGGATFDTAGYDVTVAADAVSVAEGGGAFTKTGAGTLTFPAMPANDTLSVEAGTLALTLSTAVTNRAMLAHRWSFNGSTEEENLADSVGGAVASKIGDNVAFADGAVTLSGSGNSTGSLRLGDEGAAILGTGEGATVEIWATRNAVKKWARAFDYGNNNYWWWHVTWNNDTDGTKFECGCCRNNSTKTTTYTAPWSDGAKVYIVATFTDNYNGGSNPYLRYAVYDATTKELLSSNGFTASNALTLSDLSSASFYLGHSQYSSDYDAAATYDEVRLWRHALSDEAIAKSAEFGPDATDEQIAAISSLSVPRTVTVASGATLDLGSGVLTQPVLAGNGTVSGGTLIPDAIHLNVGDCITVDGGTLDISSATVELLDPENLTADFAFARTANGGTISGTPALGSSVPSGWDVEVVNGEARLVQVFKRALTWTNTAHDFLFDNLANWTLDGEAATALPRDGDEVTLIVSGSTPITVTNRLYALDGVAVSGSGEVSFLLSGGGGISFPALDIGQGATVTLTNLMGLVDGGLTGRGTLVLDPGAGNTLTMTKDNGNNAVPFDAEYFWGEAVIKSGTVKFGNIWSFGSRRDSDDNRQVPTVRVKGGATLDENALSTGEYAGETLRVILEEGATLKSTGNSSSGLTSLILEGDATVDTSSGKVVACYNFDYGSSPVSVSLGNHTLTKVGSGQFYLSACDFSSTGTLDVQQGEVCVRVDYNNTFPTSTFESGTLRIRSGATFSLVKKGDYTTHFRVANLVLDGTISLEDGCTFTVTGAASGSGSATSVTLLEGAVIRPDGTGFFTAATISGAIVLDVSDAVSAASATGVVPLFKVGSAEALPATGSISFTGGLPAGWSLVQTEDGLGYELRARGVMFMVY